MPRGVPNSGRRQPRATSAPQAQAEATVAGGTVDGEARDQEAEALETPDLDWTVAVADEDLRVDAEPAVPAELTPEQREIKFLRDQLARLSGKQDVEPVYEEPAQDGEVILIHFLEDGLTVNGRIMFRGEELEFVVGSQAYKDTFNKLGQSWLDLRHDEFAQIDKFNKGKIMFRAGPWPGKTYADGTWEVLRPEKGEGTLPPPSAEDIARAEKARKRRAAPKLPAISA